MMVNLRTTLSVFLLVIGLCSFAQEQVITLKLEGGEKVWTGLIADGDQMPFSNGYAFNFYGNDKLNQMQPMVLTSKGQYAWSEKPYNIEIENNKVILTDPYGVLKHGKAGLSMYDAQKYVRETFFPASGKMPDELLFAAPQYNTWIELNYHQNQNDILEYAHKIIANGLPPGVLMIDDTWQEDYGLWDFHPGRFHNPKEMMKQLHDMGFKVMIWIAPFVSPDQSLIIKELEKKKAFILQKSKHDDTWETAFLPAMIRWWNGYSAVLDFTNQAAVDWFQKNLDYLQKEYDVDGFKFDGGDVKFYPDYTLNKGDILPNDHAWLYAQFGLQYPLNEYRITWKMGGQPLAQRLLDKQHSWDDLQALIPNMIIEGLAGYTFSCPDMIGGGLLNTMLDESKLNDEMIVRSAQCHALMPMMQFSVAPWRVLDEKHMAAVKKAVDLRMRFAPYILGLAKQSAKTGEPILRSLEYEFPNQGYLDIKDQFMMGSKLLVAPIVEAGNIRTVVLPNGKWKDDLGKIYKGGKTYTVEVPINRLPYFELID